MLIRRALDFLNSLRWMPILSAASALVAVLAALINPNNLTAPLTFAVVSLTLATLSKID
jgi:hypothetical protein